MREEEPPYNGRGRVVIEGITPQVDGGRFAAKRTVGDTVRVEADIFTDGHDSVAAVLSYRRENDEAWQEAPMHFVDNDRWAGEFTSTATGRMLFTVRAWVDHWETWRKDLNKRILAHNDTSVDYAIGAALIDRGAALADLTDQSRLREASERLRSEKDSQVLRKVATEDALNGLMRRHPDRRFETIYQPELALVIDPIRGRFSAWYEFFPRSTGPDELTHGTFANCEKRLDYVADMGFDVVYFPPIHPVGRQFRKGKNNTVEAEAGDVGSPWAIGAEEGGHKAIHPALGTVEDFKRVLKRAEELGMQVALDIAFQVSPDHPYVKDHEEWFRKRPDGTIQYAENPPKKYQDIYPFEFESEKWFELWLELKSVFSYWIDQGVRIFRVDNPHTKAFPFWEWCISGLKRECPDVLFLSEAFTRPKVMYRLAKLGFSQSYTYFPWRTGKAELTSYLTETSKPPVNDFFRATQWPNTPDILTEFLQEGSREAFLMRYLLAATLGSNYGIYGPAFELLESRPVRRGSEEYLNSEKYQVRHWDLDRPDSLRGFIRQVNHIRRQHAALQNDWTLTFHPVNNDQLICFSKQDQNGKNPIVVIVNLDFRHTQSGIVDLALKTLGIDEGRPFQANDLLSGEQYLWYGSRNYVELRPNKFPGHILQLMG